MTRQSCGQPYRHNYFCFSDHIRSQDWWSVDGLHHNATAEAERRCHEAGWAHAFMPEFGKSHKAPEISRAMAYFDANIAWQEMGASRSSEALDEFISHFRNKAGAESWVDKALSERLDMVPVDGDLLQQYLTFISQYRDTEAGRLAFEKVWQGDVQLDADNPGTDTPTDSATLRAPQWVENVGDGPFALTVVDLAGDGLNDGDERLLYGTDPTRADTDNDGLSDIDEMAFWGEQWNADLDGDGVINLLDADADNDGFTDGAERARGFDPSASSSRPPYHILNQFYSSDVTTVLNNQTIGRDAVAFDPYPTLGGAMPMHFKDLPATANVTAYHLP